MTDLQSASQGFCKEECTSPGCSSFPETEAPGHGAERDPLSVHCAASLGAKTLEQMDAVSS